MKIPIKKRLLSVNKIGKGFVVLKVDGELIKMKPEDTLEITNTITISFGSLIRAWLFDLPIERKEAINEFRL